MINSWHDCRFLTCSVLPVRMACNLNCLFCFSKLSISTLSHDSLNWQNVDIRRYYEFASSRGAKRLVITGGGEPAPSRGTLPCTTGTRLF